MNNTAAVPFLALALCIAGCATPRPAPPPAVAEAPPPPVAPAPTVAPSTTAASAESLTIDFAPAGSTLSSGALAMLDGAARLYRDARPAVMIVSGHSDKEGPEYQNLLLSARRANAVKEALVDRGVPSERLEMVALGEAETDPKFPASRAVVVTWH